MTLLPIEGFDPSYHQNLPIMSSILVVQKDDEEAELDFELVYLRTLTTQQRFELMFRKSRR